MKTNTRQALLLKYLPATNCKPSRISASAGPGRVTTPWKEEYDTAENYVRAATAYAHKYGWDKYDRVEVGELPDGHWCAVLVPIDGHTWSE